MLKNNVKSNGFKTILRKLIMVMKNLKVYNIHI